MDINEPSTSRTLAVLIQSIVFEDRAKFLSDAQEAESMETFMEGMSKYKRETYER
jgi:hypothetical protein